MARVVNVEQTLHGYEDGHRLLASSMKLDEASDRSMLVLSDMLTPVLYTGDEFYVSGYPLRSLGKYVIARTWLATELPRPGCVWTHSLLLDRQTLASASLWMSSILSTHRRPRVGHWPEFTVSLSVDVVVEPGLAFRISLSRASELVQALYGTDEPLVVVPASHSSRGAREDQELVGMLIEQMLPRLRDGFFFCTRTAGPIEGLSCNVMLLMDVAAESKMWLTSDMEEDGYVGGYGRLIQDLQPAPVHPLRMFISEYESDIPDPRQSVRVLAAIYDVLNERGGGALDIVSQWIQRELGAPEVGVTLKLALLRWRFGNLHIFHNPPPWRERLRTLGRLKLFASRSEIAKLVEELSVQDLQTTMENAHEFGKGTLGETVFAVVSERVPLYVLARIPFGVETKYKMAISRPKVLAFEDFWSDIQGGKHALLECLIRGKRVRSAEDFQSVIRGLGTDILAGDVETILSAEETVCSSFLRQVVSENSSAQTVLKNSPELLRQLIDLSSRLPAEDIEILGRIADGAPAEMKIDWRSWLGLAQRLDLDLTRGVALSLASVLFKAGLRGVLPEASALLYASLDPLHKATQLDNLPEEVKRRLTPYLPDLGYFRNWDFCAKLRGAVLRLCLEGGNVHPSLLTMTRSRSTLRYLLVDLGRLHNGADLLRRLRKMAKKQGNLDDSILEDLDRAVKHTQYWL